MQFHLNGFRAGDPSLSDPVGLDTGNVADNRLPETADVLIVGCGPAGLTLAAQLAAFPDIHTVIVDQKSGPLQLGQADGIACRTMEMFEAFGFAHKVLQEAYWVNETTFWKPGQPDNSGPCVIVRSGRVPDVEEGLSHMPHVILNQARVHDFYLELMQKSAARLVPYYSRRLVALARLADEQNHHPVRVQFERQGDDGNRQVETICARYVVGCDGARSGVRQALGLKLVGEAANHAWGVMDVLVNTDFPDIRFKCLVQSAANGSLLIIPREGGYMIRVYVEMDKLAENERVAGRNISLEQLIAAAQSIFYPYTFDVKEVPWWSVYEIGQRLCARFDDAQADHTSKREPRVFIAGDACHTHSPKAGQGMNVSMQDAFNIGWKLAAVLQGRSAAHLLQTYSAERQAVAKELIDFDRDWASMLSNRAAKDPAAVQTYFVQHGRYTAGTATRYQGGLVVGCPDYQCLATGLQIGTRFHSAPVVRIGDGRQIQLGQTLLADGRWRLFIFAGQDDAGTSGAPVSILCEFLSKSAASLIRLYTPLAANIDAVIDVRAVFQQSHQQLALPGLPKLLFPTKGSYGLTDYEKAFSVVLNPAQNIYTLRGINREQGCMVLVRPDQYIAHILPLSGTAELARFFGGFMLAVNHGHPKHG